jgi:hypothetical protein
VPSPETWEGLAHVDRHALANVERLDGAADRAGDRDDRLRPPASRDRLDQALRHAQEPQALARRRLKRRIASPPNRQILGLGAAPGRDQQVGDRRAGAHDVARRAAVDALHEAVRPGLHDSDVALVELQHARGGEFVGEVCALDGRIPNPEALQSGRIDLDA